MHFALHWLQAAAQARNAAEPHTITYIDFLTVTLTAICVLLAALGFIVAVVAIIGYRDIKAAAMKAGRLAVEAAIESKLKEYPDAAKIHARYNAIDGFMNGILRREALLSQVRAAPSGIANASNKGDDKPAKRPSRYPKKGE
jgi:hypothetical protein